MNEVARSTEFVAMLTDIRAGSLCHELTEKLHPLVKAVLVTGKKGEISLKLKFSPDGIGKVKVNDDLKVQMPTADMGHTILFSTDQGQLLPNDPRQMNLPLNVVGIIERPVQQVATVAMPVA